MRVDRTRFLLLTTAIASGACQPDSPPQAPVRVAAPARAAPVVPDGAPSAPHDASGWEEPGESGSADEPTTDMRDSRAGNDGEPLESPTEPIHRPSALVAECQRLRAPPAPHCEGFHFTQMLCEGFDRSLQRPVARSAVACLLRHSGRPSICNSDTRQDCFAAAIGAAPAGRHDRGRCSRLVSQCTSGGYSSKALTKASCRRAVAAVRPAFRDEMLTCIAESCGIRECVNVVEP